MNIDGKTPREVWNGIKTSVFKDGIVPENIEKSMNNAFNGLNESDQWLFLASAMLKLKQIADK